MFICIKLTEVTTPDSPEAAFVTRGLGVREERVFVLGSLLTAHRQQQSGLAPRQEPISSRPVEGGAETPWVGKEAQSFTGVHFQKVKRAASGDWATQSARASLPTHPPFGLSWCVGKAYCTACTCHSFS